MTSPALKAAGECPICEPLSCPLCGPQHSSAMVRYVRKMDLTDPDPYYKVECACGTAGELCSTRARAVMRWNQLVGAKSAITEAVDAAVAPKDKRVKELEAALQDYYRNCPCDTGRCPGCVQASKLLEAPHEP